MESCEVENDLRESSQIQIGKISLSSLERNDANPITEPLLPLELSEHRASSDCADNQPPLLQKRKRLASLDIFRGLTIAVMILVDDAGGLWPSINHSPWDGVTLADFVMPFFLFIVGISLVLALKNVSGRSSINKIFLRGLKLFLLGLILQGGYFHGTNDFQYGVDVQRIRIMGILQRIGLAYLIVAICEVSTKNISLVRERKDARAADFGFAQFSKQYPWHWVVIILLSSIYLGVLYGLTVPDWQFEDASTGDSAVIFMTVNCNVRGDLGPGCNAVGFIDRAIIGINHLYQHPVYARSKECSIYSPDYGPPPSNAPAWCFAPFDPEGLLSSIMAVVSCFIGTHYGHVLVHFEDHKRRLWGWIASSLILLVLGITMNLLGLPLNKPLYTLSYTCVTAGVAGFVFSVLYILVDIYNGKHPFIFLEWMGMNALLIFVFAASEIFPAAVQGFYWQSPANNLVSFVEVGIFQRMIHSKRWSKLVYVLFEIIFWCLVAGMLKIYGIFWKF